MLGRIEKAVLIIIGCVFLSAPTLFAETPEPYKLDNGLTVILHPMSTANNVAFVILFNLGGAHDPIGKSGMAHLLEHLYVTAAAGNTSARDVMQLQKRYPAGWNAQTGSDYTVIAGVVEPEEFAEELKDVAARMNDLRITEADLEREVPRVLQELRNMYGGMPALAGLNHTRAQLHPIPQGGQYGGDPEHIQTITRDELQQFWKDYYKPNNAILVIAGKFDVAEAQRSIPENFSQISPGKLPPTKHPTSKAKTDKVYYVNVKPVSPNATGVAAIGYAAPQPGSKAYAPFLVVCSRLWSSLQTKFQIDKVQPIFYPPLDDPTTLVLQTELLSTKDPESVLAELDQRLHTALTSSLTSQDKQQTINTMASMLGTADVPSFWWSRNLYGLAFSLGRRHQLQIDGNKLRTAIERVTDADLHSLATSIFALEKRATVIVELER